MTTLLSSSSPTDINTVPVSVPVPVPAIANKPRLMMIDVAKGIGILLIVLGHNPLFGQHFPAFADLLSAFRLPFFFFISGTMVSVGKRSVGAVAFERADAWLKPVAVVVLLSSIVYIALGRSTIEASLLGLLYATGFTLAYIWTALWFLPHLWLLYVAATWILTSLKLLSDRAWKRAVLVAALLIAGDFVLKQFDSPLINASCHRITEFNMELLHCGLPFSADLLLMTLAFFLLGHFLSTKTKQFKINRWLALLALAVMSVCQLKFDATIDFNYRRYDDLIICTLQAFSGIYLMLCICSLIARTEKLTALLAYCGRGSLFILMFHAAILLKTIDVLSRFVQLQAVVGVAAFILPILASLLIWNLCQRIELLSLLMMPKKNHRSKRFEEIATSGAANIKSVPPQ